MTWSNSISFIFYSCISAGRKKFGLKEMLKEQSINKCHTGHFSVAILQNETFCRSMHEVPFNILVFRHIQEASF